LKSWQVSAAPIFQEVLGGEDDGKKVWAGYLFDLMNFSRANGVWVQEIAVLSKCAHCNDAPSTILKCKFRGHGVYIKIYLEPIKNQPSSEIIDVHNKTIKEIPLEDRKKPEEGQEKKFWKFTEELEANSVASLFVSFTDKWYADPQNALYGKRDQVKEFLASFLETGERPKNAPAEISQVLDRFQNEWLNQSLVEI
jgi:hypothetical protein